MLTHRCRFLHKNPEDPSEVPGGFITDINPVCLPSYPGFTPLQEFNSHASYTSSRINNYRIFGIGFIARSQQCSRGQDSVGSPALHKVPV